MLLKLENLITVHYAGTVTIDICYWVEQVSIVLLLVSHPLLWKYGIGYANLMTKGVF
jgi:hypothetical protein